MSPSAGRPVLRRCVACRVLRDRSELWRVIRLAEGAAGAAAGGLAAEAGLAGAAGAAGLAGAAGAFGALALGGLGLPWAGAGAFCTARIALGAGAAAGLAPPLLPFWIRLRIAEASSSLIELLWLFAAIDSFSAASSTSLFSRPRSLDSS